MTLHSGCRGIVASRSPFGITGAGRAVPSSRVADAPYRAGEIGLLRIVEASDLVMSCLPRRVWENSGFTIPHHFDEVVASLYAFDDLDD